MKKLFTFLLFLFFITKSFAQFDTEHWFAPFANQNYNNTSCYLYLSTNTSTPFKVDIFNNNNLISTVEISKNNPSVVPINSNLMISLPNEDTQLNKPIDKGIHLVGEKKFFAHFRFSVPNHAEIITSKGKAGVGKNFYVVTPPNRIVNSYTNSTFGILATEDQTTVKISGYTPNLTFFGVPTTPASFNVILNKGESYISSALTSENGSIINSSSPSFGLLTGTLVEADKPISLTNGTFNGMYSPSTPENTSDILMDQSIPIDRLGNEFIVMSGYGSISPNNNFMEEVIILATEDQTEVFLNDSNTPYVTLNKGEFEIINDVISEGVYFKQKNGDAFTMYVKTSKNAYVYQLLAGVANSYATGGYNIVPPLNCLLPNKIEEFALIDEIGNSRFNVKMNIIAEKGANVSMNGALISNIFGPYEVDGNNKWETYSIPNVTGNVTISADKAVTAGIAAGSQNVGFGGYFAGFNSNPIISKGGNCDKNNITLEVDDTYDSYQWFYNGNPYMGTGADTYIISPTESGEYFVKIVKIGCGTLDSPIFNYQTCPYKTVNNADIANCNPIYKVTPKFSTSSQTVDLTSIKITKNPMNGVISINKATGEISYTLTNLSAVTDTFTYSFSGTDPKFSDTEFVTVNINVKYLKVFTGESFACIKPDNTGDFNLTEASISKDSNISQIQYYENYNTSTKTFSNLISNFTNYNSVPKTIYAKVTNSFGCIEATNIDLKFYPIPNINTITYNSILCDTNLDGLYEVDFQKEVAPLVINGYQNFDIYYSLTNDFSVANRLPNNWSYSTPTRVYVLVASKSGCTDATGFIDFKIGAKITVNNIEIAVCDNERDGKTNIKISDYLPSATAGTQYLYYNSFQKAQEAITGTTTSDDQEITNNTTFYIRTENPGFCPNIFELQIIFNQPNVSTTLKDKVICKNTTTIVDAGTGFTYYKWSNGTEGATLQTATYGVGTHYVELTSTNGCIYKQSFTISEAVDPVIDSVIEQGNSITVNVSGGTAPYEYSLDQINWQKSNFFDNLRRGVQKVYVRDANICTPIEYEFSIINLINAITPNSDGINDVLDYSDLRVKKDVKISIFDRFGKKVYSSEKQSNYIWNGTENGRSIITGTYWYVLEWIEPDTNTKVTYKNWIIVKNRN